MNFLAGTLDTGSIIIMVVLVVAIIGLFIWSSYSNKKKQKQAQEMLNDLKVGDKVKTIGGICGYIVEINNNENTFVLKTGSDNFYSYAKFDKNAIYQTAHVDNNGEEAKAEQPKEEPKKSTKKAKSAKAAEVKEEPKAEEKVEEPKAEEKAEEPKE